MAVMWANSKEPQRKLRLDLYLGLLEKVSDRIRKIDEEEGLLLEWVIKNESVYA